MDLHALTLLVEILDAGNLSEAARRLKMTRANVSYHLNQFERSIGQQLVRRTTRRVEATEIGLRLYEHGQAIRDQLLAAREVVATLGRGLMGRVRLSVPSGYGQVVMAGWLIEFKRLYPGIVLDVVFENRIDDLLRDEIDIAVRVVHEPPQNVVARDMGPVRYITCASRAYAQAHAMPQDPDALRSAPLIMSAAVTRQLRVAAYLGNERHEVFVEPTLISENYLFLREAVLAGIGVGLLPDYLVQSEIESGAVVTALDDWRLSIFGSKMVMLYMPNRHHTRAAATFIDYVLERARAVGPQAGDGQRVARGEDTAPRP